MSSPFQSNLLLTSKRKGKKRSKTKKKEKQTFKKIRQWIHESVVNQANVFYPLLFSAALSSVFFIPSVRHNFLRAPLAAHLTTFWVIRQNNKNTKIKIFTIEWGTKTKGEKVNTQLHKIHSHIKKLCNRFNRILGLRRGNIVVALVVFETESDLGQGFSVSLFYFGSLSLFIFVVWCICHSMRKSPKTDA